MMLLKRIFGRVGGFLIGERVGGRRIRFYVLPEFQKDFITFFLVMVLILVVTTGGAYYFFLITTIEERMYTIHPQFGGPKELITPHFILFFLEVTAIVAVIIAIFTHLFLKRVGKALKSYDLITDRLAKLELRQAKTIKPATFPYLAKEYRDLIDVLTYDISFLKEKTSRIKLLLKLLMEDNNLSQEQVNTIVMELAALKGAIETKLAEYECERGKDE